MKRTLDRRVLMRAVIVFVLAAAALTLMQLALGESAKAEPTAAVAAEAAHAGAVSTEIAAPDDAVEDDELVPDDTGVEEDAGMVNTSGANNRALQLLFNGIVFGLLLALASVGLSLIYGTTGLSNFAHAEQVSFGAVLCYFFATSEPVSVPFVPGSFVINMPLALAAILAVAVSAATGWLQDRYLWSPLRRRRVAMVQQMIVSIGLSLAVLNALQWWVGGRRLRLTTSIDERWAVGPIVIGRTGAISAGIAIVCLAAVGYFLLRTRMGRATRAVSDNAALAAASGIKVDSIVRLVWILAAGLAGLGGILLGLYDQGTAFDAGARLLLLMFAAVTLGGLGQAFGALVGSLVIGIVVEMSSLFLAPDLKVATALVILIGVLLVRPQGILGRAERVG